MPVPRFAPLFIRLAVACALLAAPQVSAATNSGSATAVVTGFYATLLGTMKDGPALKFAGRTERLTPALASAFDLAGMTRIAAGAQWPAIKPEEQRQLIDSFSRFSIATYAANFDGWGGERFEVLKEGPAPGSPNSVIVETRLVTSTGEPVQLNYLLRPVSGSLRIIDVFLNGTISELAARRSEFASVLTRDGAKGLYEMLEKRIKALAAK
ncbi:MAG: ABC transporter substrate-binding protein [Rhodospirillaceae bacterium]